MDSHHKEHARRIWSVSLYVHTTNKSLIPMEYAWHQKQMKSTE